MDDEQTSIADLISHALVGISTAQRLLTAARPRASADGVELDSLRDEVAALREIIEGRTTPPTDEEIYAHEVAGGMWVATPARKTISGRSWSCAMSTAYEVRRFLVSPGDRWIPLGADGRPCAWPTAAAEVKP